MKLWLKTPFPGEKNGDGVWHECATPYEKRLWFKHNKNKWLPTVKAEEAPEERENK